jgi:DNA polymerase III, delta subunit
MIWNEQAQSMVNAFFTALREGKTVFPFLILAWRPHIWKTSCVETMIHDLVGEFVQSDYVALYDISEQLGKEHTIKIESGRDDEYITHEEKTYCNRWMRELQQRLARAPMGDWKVVYIENMERMTNQAANALLKSLEEPLPWRLIIGTVSDTQLLLATIRSRALVIPFSLVDTETMRQALLTHYPALSSSKIDFLLGFSFGARGLVEQLMQSPDGDLWEEQYTAITNWFKKPTLVHEQLTRIQWFVERGQLHQLIDALLYAGHGNPEILVRIKKLLETNVGQDNILFLWCIRERENAQTK